MAAVPKWLEAEARNYADADWCRRLRLPDVRRAFGLRTIEEEEGRLRQVLRERGDLEVTERWLLTQRRG